MLEPFLKWAGGKRWLMNNNKLPIPLNFNKYIEPFLGSGAIFFLLEPQNAYLSDINNDLIELYKVIRDRPKEFSKELQIHHNMHSKEYYYRTRNNTPSDDLKKAARFLYLNRTCWNGLYRVNLKGEFNVPLGTKTSVVLKTDDFVSISNILKRAEIICNDFEQTVDLATKGDFLFVDPPYTVQHNTNNFIKYNEKIFSWDDQMRLKEALVRAKRRDVQIVVTNADHNSVRELYSVVGEYQQLTRHSVLAADPLKRGYTTEAMFVANLKHG